MRCYLPLLALVACEKEGKESSSEPQGSCLFDIESAVSQEGKPLPAGGTLTFEKGSQGGFHTEIGGLMHMYDQTVALSILVTDSEGALIASNGNTPTYYALVDYDQETCGGWITTRTLLGGQFEIEDEVACTYNGIDATLEISAGPIEASEPATLSVPVQISVPGC